MQARPQLSVVVPAYNEEPRIRHTLERLAAFLESAPGVPRPAEVVVVDDGSTDGTAGVVDRFAAGRREVGVSFRLLRNGKNRGKGYSIKHGVLLAAGEVLLLTDADLSTPIEESPRLLGLIASAGYGIAIGSRGLRESRVEKHQPAWREIMGRCFNRLVKMITGLPFCDTQCGFKAMRRETVLPLFRAARVCGFAYDVEILYLARKAGIPVIEEPVVWRDSRGSKVNPISDSLDMLKDVLRVKLRDRRGGYGSLGRPAATRSGLR